MLTAKRSQNANFTKKLVNNTQTVSYYRAIKYLKNYAFSTHKQLVPNAPYSAKQALWLKIKKQLIDKDLRQKAFISKNEELTVKSSDVETLALGVKARITDTISSQNKKNDRMISLGYAESKVRDFLRRSDYHNPAHVATIMRDIQHNLKKTISGTRIALSKLEELTVTAMKKFKNNNRDPQILSRLGAEVKILTAIKNANLSEAQEITATNKILDKLSGKSRRNNLTKEYVNEVIQEILTPIKEKQKEKQKKLVIKKQPTKKIEAKKEQKRGKSDKLGRWGNSKKPERHS
jgi:hypothetical protein